MSHITNIISPGHLQNAMVYEVAWKFGGELPRWVQEGLARCGGLAEEIEYLQRISSQREEAREELVAAI